MHCVRSLGTIGLAKRTKNTFDLDRDVKLVSENLCETEILFDRDYGSLRGKYSRGVGYWGHFGVGGRFASKEKSLFIGAFPECLIDSGIGCVPAR